LLGIDVQPWEAAGVGLTLSASAYLSEIWRGCVEAIPRGQWDAAAALGLKTRHQLRLVILPQALRIAVAPSVGYLVQLVKSTALTSIIGFDELLKTSNVINNATFAPFTVYGVVAAIYFVLCFPLTVFSRWLERKLRRI
jgi:polar amino acid transport system permease protein